MNKNLKEIINIFKLLNKFGVSSFNKKQKF